MCDLFLRTDLISYEQRSPITKGNAMPQLIEYIDAIARQKQREVLFLTFDADDYFELGEEIDEEDLVQFEETDWEKSPVRQMVIDWLNEKKFAWQPCAGPASENCIDGYTGHIYVDVPYDETNPDYMTLRDFLEHPDGKLRFEGMAFYRLPLATAMKNAHHDEPGYWDKTADNF
jgi:hypothetical protein